MKGNQFSVASLILIMLVLILAALGFYFKDKNETSNQQVISLKTESSKLSNEIIVESIEKLRNVKFAKAENAWGYNIRGGYEGFNESDIYRGDIDQDGDEDALIRMTGCGASCGYGFVVVLNSGNNHGVAFNSSVERLISSGAVQTGIKDIKIHDGIISISADNFPIGYNQSFGEGTNEELKTSNYVLTPNLTFVNFSE